MIDAPEKVLLISHLRQVLGFACKHVALTGEPIIVQRYNRQEVAIVPLADWRYYQQLEAADRTCRHPWEDHEATCEARDSPRREVDEC